MKFEDFFKGSNVLVTGAAGSVGQALVDALLALPVDEVRMIDNNESELFYLQKRLSDEPRANAFVTDIRDARSLKNSFSGIDYVFHAAALKHVGLCERSPDSAVQTNIVGLENVIEAARANNVKKVLFTSSDKAVNPTNVMGTSKLMGERLITAANSMRRGEGETIFSSTRFGNVTGSRGSVIPIFFSQIEEGSDITLTHPDMTRFFMTIEEAVKLLLESIMHAQGGEVFVTKMPAVKIADLAATMIKHIAPCFGRKPATVKVKQIGVIPGEKMMEELVSEEEIRRAYESDKFIIVLPAIRNIYNEIAFDYPWKTQEISKAYASSDEKLMGEAEILDLLREPGVLPDGIAAKLR